MATSQNGWPVNPPRRSRLVPGTSDVRVTVADGPAGDVLMYVLAQFHQRVESLELDSSLGEKDDWGYANRPIIGGVATSNHASATAVDVNATRHPLGARGTFTRDQVNQIHAILVEVSGVVRWGGDYSGRKDEMHFEINAGHAAVAAVAARIPKDGEMPLTTSDLNGIWMFPCTGIGPDGKSQTHPAVVWITAMAYRVAAIEQSTAQLAGREPLAVTENAIAADLAPMLVEALAEQLSSLSNDDLTRIASAISDEQTRRNAA